MKLIFKAATDSHIRELLKAGEELPTPEMTEIPGLTIGVPSGTITLEWTDVEIPIETNA